MRKMFILFLILASAALGHAQYGFDLSLSNFEVTYDRNPLYEGDVVNLKVTITNNSETSQSWKNITFYYGETSISSLSLYPALAAGDSRVMEVKWTARPGKGKFRVVSPADDNMADNELNHPDEVEVVRKYANELVLSDFNISSGEEKHTFYVGDAIEVSMKITNQGRDAQQNIAVSLYRGDAVIDTKTIPSLDAEAAETVIFNYTSVIGFDTFKVTLPEDENNANNEASRSVFVFPTGIWIESFEAETFPPSGWTSEGGWSRSYGGYHGDYYASASGSASNEGKRKLITPKLDIRATDSLIYGIRISFAYQMRVSTSTDMVEWEEVEIIGPGDNTYVLYKMFFNDEKYARLVGKRYFAFELVNTSGAFGMDLVLGARTAPVEDDFELVELSTTGFLQEGAAGTFNFSIKNNGAKPDTKALYLKKDGELLVSGTTGLMQAGEEKTVSLEWAPTGGATVAVLTGSIEADDADGNNFKSLTTMIYPIANLPLHESFEQSTAIATGYPYWTVTNRSSAPSWRVSTGSSIYNPTCTPYEGTNVLALYCMGSAAKSDFITPLYIMPYEKYTISFRLFRDSHAANIAKADGINVYFNTQPSTTDASLLGTIHRSTALEPVAEDGEAWYLYSFEVDAKEISQGFFIFEGFAAASYRNIFIDSLTVTGISEHDLALTGIFPATGSVIWGHEQATADVKVTIENVGVNTMTSATIRWSINGEQQQDVAWSGNLAVSETAEVILKKGALFETGKEYIIRTEVVSELDITAFNNVLETTVESAQAILLPYQNGFEEETSLDYWLHLDEDGDGFGWLPCTATPQSGTVSMESFSFDEEANEALTPDNWLVSPGVYVEYNKVFLSFYVGAGDAFLYEETYEALISETVPEPQAFKSIHKETLTEGKYKQVTLELEGYKGKVIFLAFRHVESSDNWSLIIDNISLYNPELYTVTTTASPAAGGSVTGGDIYENETEATVTAITNSGYEFINWTAGGVEKSTKASYTFTVTENIQLTANFKALYNVSATASPAAGGTVTGAGTFLDGTNITVNATANTGYEFVNWTAGGVEKSTNASYSFIVTEDIQLTANFKALYDVTLTASPTTGGTVSGAGTFLDGSSVTVSAIANTGYEFVNWTTDGDVKSSDANYTFNITSDVSLTANFELLTFDIVVATEGEGTITPSETVTVEYGQSQSFVIEAAQGWIIADVLINNSSVGNVSSYTFENVTAGHSIKAIFEPETAIPGTEKTAMMAYPNPTGSQLQVTGDGASLGAILLYDLSGKLVYEMNNVNATEWTIDMSGYVNGIYFLNIDGKTIKVVKN